MAEKGLLDVFTPNTRPSGSWKNWKAILDLKTCEDCRSRHGKIYRITEKVDPEPPLHIMCRCGIKQMEAVLAGQASKETKNGADWWLAYRECLPEYYITREELELMGWRWGKAPSKFAPGKMPVMGIYRNEDGRLPDAPGRIWFEADLNYYSGRRNGHRILFSNDGLIFVTYNHYRSFYEIAGV